ncbi:PLD nuclease N-terminal domain-containing protein [Naasia lichenicola]|uniref:PLDc_N domain-containing protein n=1 Tax=Naasia lichenicola TaxID=2565933 RepID=A0A4S4FIX3_9MICO|nr:PLD nuclease N-terminal domain-containing protein [Naasia lichenicola]THG29834.1 PLDc_N domain-containing protein [Naasia lichenicola]
MSVLLWGASIVLLIFALIDIIIRVDGEVRGLPKIAWILICIFLPLVGSIVWFAVGHDWSAAARNHGRYTEPIHRTDRYSTPADARQAQGDRRVSGTEQELAALEREIEYWEAQARLKRAKDAASDGEPIG